MPAPARTALWLAAYVLASLLGRITVVQPHDVVVVWPASGIALVWLVSAASRNQLVIDTVLLSVSTALVLALTEGGVLQSSLALLSVVQTLLARWLIRRWVPHIWGGGGRRPMSKLTDFGRILAAVAIGALAMAVLRTALGLLLVPDEVIRLGYGRWGRNAAAMATVGIFGMLLGGWLAERRERGLPALSGPSRNDVLHGVGITAVTVGIFYVGFNLNPVVPSTFMLTLTVVWCAIRYNLVTTAAHSLAAGGATVVLTILGHGPIAEIGRPEVQALVAQVFVVVLLVIGMTIALTRRQFFDTIASLERSEATLAARADELDMVLSRLDDGVAIIEETGRVVHANLALRTVFGTRIVSRADRLPEAAEATLYTPDGQQLPPEGSPFVRALAGEVVEAEEYHRPGEDGSVMVLEISAFLVPTAPGAPRRVMVVVRDVTSATTHRESLVSFAGTVAHDLNNPLSVIDGWAEALEDDLDASGSEETARTLLMVRHIRAGVEQARGFISALLAHSVSRDQALECEPVPLGTMVKDVATARDGPRGGDEIVASELPDVWADRVLLRQLLDNLIGNALKYVAPGTLPRVLVDSERLDGGWARVMVHDNGIGVPFLQRERIFESFHRATDGYQGTGLGLAICKRIVERHGGTIRVGANPDGIGSCFEFTLPMTEEAFTAATSP